jgi:FkbM family methyltransferase
MEHAMQEINESNARQSMDTCVQSLPASNTLAGNGRGVVICGGGKYFVSAYVCIRMLRANGCSTPIELWHLGPSEKNETMTSLTADLGVTWVDAHEVRKSHPSMILNGWELKPYAIIHSRFREVIALDADNVPLIDPSKLFETGQYMETGAIFWPDYQRLAPGRPIWNLTGVAYRDEPEFESGQIVVDKFRCYRELLLTMWMNEHSDFWYSFIHGDKETFHLSWRKLGRSYSMPNHPIYPLAWTMCQHDFDGNIIFQHRNMAKWTLRGNRQIPGFIRENECIDFINDLPVHPHLTGISYYDPRNKSSEVILAARVLVDTDWTYERIGHDSRAIKFLPDGSIGAGGAAMEQFWDISILNNNQTLDIYSGDSRTCRLVWNRQSMTWEGRWDKHERMLIAIKKETSNKLKDFSQYGEQKFITEYFRSKKTHPGVFLDVGASDGISHSNTHALHLAGWRGILVEPVREEYARLCETYKNTSNILVNSAVSDKHGEVEMWVTKQTAAKHGGRDNRNTLDADFAGASGANYEKQPVSSITPADLALLINGMKIDFASIDTEGLDGFVIKGLFDNKVYPSLIMWECDKGSDRSNQVIQALTTAGYRELYGNGVNSAWELIGAK